MGIPCRLHQYAAGCSPQEGPLTGPPECPQPESRHGPACYVSRLAAGRMQMEFGRRADTASRLTLW